ncbi:MAG: SpoIIE family protein phosphatase, partial [Acidobacteriales bacterium]|nr:SpoIIE family protein phosphatase [Terriglobales bacterium]
MANMRAQLLLAESKTSPVRRWMERHRLLPLSAMGRFFWRTFAITVVLTLLAKMTGGHGIIGTFVAVLSALAWVVAVPVGFYLLARWLLSGILWRLRNRLIVTYLFIGGAPLLLVLTLALISAWFLSGQFAAFLATSDLNEHLAQIASENRSIGAHLAGDLSGKKADLRDVPELKDVGSRRVVVLFDSDGRMLSSIGAPFAHPQWLTKDTSAIAHDGSSLFFRSSYNFVAKGRQYSVISSEPLNSESMGALLSGLGEINLYGSSLVSLNGGDYIAVDEGEANQASKQIKQAQGEERKKKVEELQQQSRAERIHSGSLPPAQNKLDGKLQYVSPLAVIEWATGKDAPRALTVTTRPSVLYGRLFRASTVWGTTLRDVLFGTTVFFAFLELFALFIGMRLTRSVTHAVHELYFATQQIERGELHHRIRVRSNDQLAALEGSFNHMSESLDKLLQEQREKERLQSELAIAQEVQEQLFPRAWTSSRYLDLFGVCKPARSVSGDYYDFVSLSPTRTLIAMGDIAGKGISAALLMATIQSAVRSYELGVDEEPALLTAAGGGTAVLTPSEVITGTTPAQTMRLLNRHLYRSTPPEKYATMFLGIYDGQTRTLSYTNGGHLPPLVIRRDGTVERLEISGTVIGLFEDMMWEQSQVTFAPGDLLIAYSDGVTEPENEFGEFGEERLMEFVRDIRTLPLEEVARRTLATVQE